MLMRMKQWQEHTLWPEKALKQRSTSVDEKSRRANRKKRGQRPTLQRSQDNSQLQKGMTATLLAVIGISVPLAGKMESSDNSLVRLQDFVECLICLFCWLGDQFDFMGF